MSGRNLWAANAIRDLVLETLGRYDVVINEDTSLDGDCVRLADEILERAAAVTAQSTRMNSLRHRVARLLYNDGAEIVRPEWEELPPDRKRPWLEDADRVIPTVIEACALVADQANPEKPTEYLFPRERIGSAMKGLFVGMPSDECEE